MPKSLTVSRAATNVMVIGRPGHCALPALGLHPTLPNANRTSEIENSV